MLSTVNNVRSAAKIKLEIKYIKPIYNRRWIIIQEEFKHILLEDGTVIDDYLVSNYGRVYSFKTNKLLTPTERNGYLSVSLNYGDIQYPKRINRLVMMTFAPVQNANLLQVNHINGNKLDNRLSNLEWCTAKENIAHAIRTGLRKIGEDHHDATITNKQVEEICKMLEQGFSYEEIYNTIQPDIKYQNFRKIIYNIRYGESWQAISKNYNFSREKQRHTDYSDQDIHLICKSLEEGKSYNEIADLFCLTDKSDRRLFKKTIIKIANKNTHTDISSNYNIEKPRGLREQLFTNEQIHIICKLISQNCDSFHILNELGIDINSFDKNKRTNILRSINSIRNKKTFTHISNKYF